MIFANGRILAATGPTHAIAVRDGVVRAVGDDAIAIGGPVVDLGGGTLLPGFRDGHVHPLHGGIELVELPLAGAANLDAMLERVAAYARAHPDKKWIVGGGFEPALLPGGLGDAHVLDAVIADRPVALEAADHHTMWVNTAALARAGLSTSTPEPQRGRIVRRPDGSPLGTLIEFDATDYVQRVLPVPTMSERREGLAAGLHHLTSLGIVWAQDASIDADDAAVYVAAAHDGALDCRMNLAWRAMPGDWRKQEPSFVSGRAAIASDPACAGLLSAFTVKFFADGVIEAGTGYLLEPYDDAPHSCGLPNWSPAGLSEAVAAFDADGFQIHIHAIGDGGVRMALDAIEHATARNGARDRRPVIAHTQLVHPDDLARFAALGVIANFEPLWAHLDSTMTELTIPRLGPARSALQYPIETMRRSGAPVSFGSDWPVSSASPLEGLAVAVTRQLRDGTPRDGWLPSERVPIALALHAYTAGSAYQAFDDSAGTIAVGAPADLCLVGADVTAVGGLEVADVPVLGTWVGGRQVYGA